MSNNLARKCKMSAWKKVILVAVICSVLATPVIIWVRQGFRTCICAAQLVSIGTSLLLYQRSNANGENPPDIQKLIEAQDLPPGLLVCPSDNAETGAYSYQYRGNDLDKSATDEMILFYEKSPNHRYKECPNLLHKIWNVLLLNYNAPRVRNVLFCDGHVMQLTKGQFQNAIQRDNELRKRFKLVEKPAN